MGFGETAEVEHDRLPIESESIPMDESGASESDTAVEAADEFCSAATKKVKFEDVPEEADEKLESWDDYDSFPEFPLGEVPDFLVEIAAKRDSSGRIKASRRRGGEGAVGLPLYKQRSWSNESYREEAWLRRKENSMRRSKSVTDEDLDELRGCIELGFRFDNRMDRSLSGTLPALDLFHAVNRQYADCVSGSSASDCSGSPIGSPQSFFGPGDRPEIVKARLKQWAQVVACSVQHFR